jgi:hypothetical protein
MLQHIVRPKPDDSNPESVEAMGPRRVIPLRVGLVVLAAVAFDDEFRFDAVKIGDVSGDWELPAKLERREFAIAED